MSSKLNIHDMPTITKVQNPKMQPESVTGFIGGGNTFQDETVIKDSELSKFKNILLSVDGIEPRPGSLNYGGSQDSRVRGLEPFYKADGTRKLIRFSGGKVYYKNGSSWTQLGTKTWTTDTDMNMLQVRNNIYFFNATEVLSYSDGSTITSFTALTTPVGLTVAAQGTTGSTAYSYRISAFNSVGETLACTAVAITNGNANIDVTNYNKLDWTAVSGATGYNVYGRTATGLGETFLATVYTNKYNDTATTDAGDYLSPSNVILPPEANTTTGITCAKGVFSQSRIFAAGDPNNPSRLYYGGAGSNINTFYFSENGGGATDIFKDDGSVIRDILPFQGGVIVWKDTAIYKFYLNSLGQPTLEEVTRAFGGISWRGSRHVENDVIFPTKKDGRLAFYSLGNQENYSSNILRTNELTIKVAKNLRQVNVANLTHAASFYFNNIYGCAVATEDSSTNDRIWCLDTRFGSWVYWDGMSPNCFSEYTDTDGTQKMYHGSDTTGYVVEMFTDDRNDNGVAISVQFATKAFNQKAWKYYKKYMNPTFQFKDITRTAAISGDIILDGATVSANFTINQQTTGGGGAGAYLPGVMLPGIVAGVTSAQEASADTIVELNWFKRARSIKYEFRSNSINARYKFLSLSHNYMILEGKRLPSTVRQYIS